MSHEWHHPAIRKGLLIGSAAAAAAWWTPALAPIVPAVAGALGLPRRIDDPVGVALTFDDGPHPEGTPAVLEALAAARRARDLLPLRRAGGAGPGAGRRDRRRRPHGGGPRLPPPEHAAARPRAPSWMTSSGESPRSRTRSGLRPELYRPPYGIFSYPGMVEVQARGLRSLLWSRWGHDWRARRTAAEIAGRGDARPGRRRCPAAPRRRSLQRARLLARDGGGAADGGGADPLGRAAPRSCVVS